MENIEPTPTTSEQLKPERVRGRRRRRHSKRFRTLRRWLRRVRWRYILVIVVTVVVVAVGLMAVLVTDALNKVDQSQASLERVLNSLNNKSADEWTFSDFERLQARVNDLVASLNRAESRTVFLQPFRGMSSELDNSFLMLDTAQELGLGVNDMLTGLQLTIAYLTEGQEDTTVAQVSSGERTIDLLEKGRGRFINASQHLDQVSMHLAEFDRATLSADLLLQLEDLEEFYEQARQLNDILIESPELLSLMLGSDETRTYLILSQNNDELRPSGGFVSTWGWMRVENSRIDAFNYFPSTVDNPRPPAEAFSADLEIPDWWIHFRYPVYAAWDSSWYADFPSTAQLAVWYYETGNNPHAPVDGVIAIDLIGLEYILEAMGEVYIEAYDETVTVENFRDVIYRIRAEAGGDHKAFVAEVYREMLEEWQNVDPSRKADVLGAQLQALREKHIMLYFAETELNAALNTLGWSGAMEPAIEHDYIMIADANVTPNKSNSSIIRQTSYDVEVAPDGHLNSRLTVSYDYSGSLAANDPAVAPEHGIWELYINLSQVFVPRGSILTVPEEAPRNIRTIQMDEHTMFTATVRMDYNEAMRLEYEYETPVLVESFGDYRRYRLLIQKQPGLRSEQVDLLLTLPSGSSIVSSDPEPDDQFALDGLVLTYSIDLVRDEWIEIIYRQ